MAAILALPMDQQRPGLLVALVIVASLGAKGLVWPRTMMAVWFVVLIVVTENTPPQPTSKAVTGIIGYLVPVSYTHLDVYKRQVVISPTAAVGMPVARTCRANSTW